MSRGPQFTRRDIKWSNLSSDEQNEIQDKFIAAYNRKNKNNGGAQAWQDLVKEFNETQEEGAYGDSFLNKLAYEFRYSKNISNDNYFSNYVRDNLFSKEAKDRTDEEKLLDPYNDARYKREEHLEGFKTAKEEREEKFKQWRIKNRESLGNDSVKFNANGAPVGADGAPLAENAAKKIIDGLYKDYLADNAAVIARYLELIAQGRKDRKAYLEKRDKPRQALSGGDNEVRHFKFERWVNYSHLGAKFQEDGRLVRDDGQEMTKEEKKVFVDREFKKYSAGVIYNAFIAYRERKRYKQIKADKQRKAENNQDDLRSETSENPLLGDVEDQITPKPQLTKEQAAVKIQKVLRRFLARKRGLDDDISSVHTEDDPDNPQRKKGANNDDKSSIHTEDDSDDDNSSNHTKEGDPEGDAANQSASRSLGNKDAVPDDIIPFNQKDLKNAYARMKGNAQEWPRRLADWQYKEEIAPQENSKQRPVLDSAGRFLRFEAVKEPLQDKAVNGIVGDTSNAEMALNSEAKLREFNQYFDGANQNKTNILLGCYGNAYAQYYGLSSLHDQLRDAQHYYALDKNRITKEGDFCKTYACVYDGGIQKDCEITATSGGVTLAFIEPKQVQENYEAKFREFCEKICSDDGNGNVITNGEAMLSRALILVGAEPPVSDKISAEMTEAQKIIAQTYNEKREEAEKLVRSWAREHVMAEIQKETEVAMAYQRSLQPTIEDYKAIEQSLRSESLSGQINFAVIAKDQTIRNSGMGSLFFTQEDKIRNFKKSILALKSATIPLSVNSGVAFGYGKTDDVVNVAFNFPYDTGKAPNPTLTSAYIHLPGTNECYIKVQVSTFSGNQSYYENGKGKRRYFKEGEIIFHPSTIFHRTEINGKMDYAEVNLNSIPKTIASSSSQDIIKEAYKNMKISVTSQIGANRNMLIKCEKDLVISKELGKVAVLDEKKDVTIFTKKISLSAQDSPWQPSEILMRCPDFKSADTKESLLYEYASQGLTDAEADALLARRKNVFIKAKIATKSGLVILNNGHSIYVEEGETYKEPLPYTKDAAGKEQLIDHPYDIRNGLGSSFMANFSEVEISCKVEDEYKKVERELRDAFRYYNGSNASKQRLEDILEKIESHLKDQNNKHKININAQDPNCGKTALHYALSDEMGQGRMDVPDEYITRFTKLPDVDLSLRDLQYKRNSLGFVRRNFKDASEFIAARLIYKYKAIANDDKPYLAQNSGYTAASRALKSGRYKLARDLQGQEIDSMIKNVETMITDFGQLKNDYGTFAEQLQKAQNSVLESGDDIALVKGKLRQEVKNISQIVDKVSDESKYFGIIKGYQRVLKDQVAELEKVKAELKKFKEGFNEQNSNLWNNADKNGKKKIFNDNSIELRELQNKISACGQAVENGEQKIVDDIKKAENNIASSKPSTSPAQPIQAGAFRHGHLIDVLNNIANKGAAAGR